jgi:hypothetical protein
VLCSRSLAPLCLRVGSCRRQLAHGSDSAATCRQAAHSQKRPLVSSLSFSVSSCRSKWKPTAAAITKQPWCRRLKFSARAGPYPSATAAAAAAAKRRRPAFHVAINVSSSLGGWLWVHPRGHTPAPSRVTCCFHSPHNRCTRSVQAAAASDEAQHRCARIGPSSWR